MAKTYRVLIVEDSTSDAALVEKELKNTLKKCIFKRVDTKEEFLKFLNEFKPDIIVSDYKMPNFDGLTALKLTLVKSPRTPFIMLTESMSEDTAVKCMKAGATDYIIKEHIKRLGTAASFALEQTANQSEKTKVQEALRENDEKYKTLFSNARESIFIAAAESGIILDCNEAACALVERTKEELVGKHQSILHPPDELTGEFTKSFRRHITVDQGRMLNARVITKSGIIKDVEISANLLNLRRKKVIHGFFIDVTERKRAEKALRESEKRLKDAQVLGRIGTWEFDIESKKITWSDQTYKLYDRDPALGPPTVKEEEAYYSPEQVKILRKHAQRAIEEKKDFEYDLEAKLPSGKDIYFLARMQPIQDAQGRVVKLFGTVQDITERKLIEEALAREKYLLNSLIETTPDHIYFKDSDSRFIKINSAMTKTFGLHKSEEALGKTDFDFFDEEHARPAFECEQQIMTTGELFVGQEEKEVWPDGRITWVSTTKVPLRDKTGKITGIMGISRDITERKQAEKELKERERKLRKQNEEYQRLNREYSVVNEELTDSIERVQKMNRDLKISKEKAEESDKLKSAFLANMSHEIRTPMNAIIGFSGLLTDPSISKDKNANYIRLINSSCQQLLYIINDIIDISKIEANQIRLSLEVVNLDDLLKELYITYKIQAENKSLSLIYLRNQTNDIIQINTDKHRMKQVLGNLLSNAIKFTHKGNIEYGYSVKESFIELYVKDTGIGIAPENHSLIFERFRQVESTITRNYGGNGLGLSIAKALVEKLGGIIKLKSELGKGSTFCVSVPYDINIKTSVDTTIDHKDVAYLNWIEKTILVVEDEANNFFYIREILSDKQVMILHAWNGKEAVDMVKDNPAIDLVLMDIKMPIMDGYEAKRIIKIHNPDLPVLAITAYAMSDEEEKVLKEGFNGYISKPIVSNIFMETITNHLL